MTATQALALKLDRPLAFIDLETTGTNTQTDRIVEIAVLIVGVEGLIIDSRVRRLNPGVPIPAAATAVHGISDADVAEEPTFVQVAVSLDKTLAGCDLAGFNITRFDVPLLETEFKRVGLRLDVLERRIIDLQTVFHSEEPRDLTAAAAFYAEIDHSGAHAALADVEVCLDVLNGQLGRYDELPSDVQGLHDYCHERRPYLTPLDQWFDRSVTPWTLRRSKHKGRDLEWMAHNERGFLDWMLRADDMDPMVTSAVMDILSGRFPW